MLFHQPDKIPFSFLFLFSFICAKCAGRIVSDSINEKIRTTIVTTGIILQILPKAPSTNIIGEKVTIVVKTAKITGLATW